MMHRGIDLCSKRKSIQIYRRRAYKYINAEVFTYSHHRGFQGIINKMQSYTQACIWHSAMQSFSKRRAIRGTILNREVIKDIYITQIKGTASPLSINASGLSKHIYKTQIKGTASPLSIHASGLSKHIYKTQRKCTAFTVYQNAKGIQNSSCRAFPELHIYIYLQGIHRIYKYTQSMQKHSTISNAGHSSVQTQSMQRLGVQAFFSTLGQLKSV